MMFSSRNTQRITSDHLIISSLKATQLLNESKSLLPAELISNILELLSVPDLMRFARTSKRMLEMVYEDSRWVQRLQAIGVWNEEEARRRRAENFQIFGSEIKDNNYHNINWDLTYEGKLITTSNALHDIGRMEAKQLEMNSIKSTQNYSYDTHETRGGLTHFPKQMKSVISITTPDPEALLHILNQVKSIRGFARHEFAKIYAALAPYYYELTRSPDYSGQAIFNSFPNLEQQAQILAQILRFSRCDWAMGWKERDEKLSKIIHAFEIVQLREFEHGFITKDIHGKMREHARVLAILNGGQTAINYFVENCPMLKDQRIISSYPLDCPNQDSYEGISLPLFINFLEDASRILNEQSEVIDCVFPQAVDILHIVLGKFVEERFVPYVNSLLKNLYEKNPVLYIKAFPNVFEQSLKFGLSIRPSRNSSQNFSENVKKTIAKVFELQLNLYLQEELKYFKRNVESEGSKWEKKLNAQDATTESFLMANFNRVSDKKDFITSFKKVFKMPTRILPSVSKFGTKNPLNRENLYIPTSPSSISSQSPGSPHTNFPVLSPISPIEMTPNEELIARTAFIASQLEGIRSLVSIEVALKFTHAAKESIERTALFVCLSGQSGEKARKQCSLIYVSLIQILGEQHVQSGFDRAVNHLSKYNPREVIGHQQAVVPLVNFLELVNVGDLISQMIDVFYEQQLCANKLSDLNDSFDPAIQAKKNFEKMLDSCVAAGLNQGIDVLMGEVEYICATVQLPTDYNPSSPSDCDLELRPSKAAELIVTLVESHTKILEGGTDKKVLDAFNQEVGLRLFSVLCRHLKRQRISINGAMKLISDMNHYFLYIKSLRNNELLEYFKALKALSQIFLIAPSHAKEIAEVVADKRRFSGLFSAEEVYEFVQRRADWYSVKKNVEKAMYGIGCIVM